MAYKPPHTGMGMRPIDLETNTVQKHVLGTLAKAYDDVYGEGEFIYLKGVVGTLPGSAVVYDPKNATTTLTVAASRGPMAIAMAANVASQFGWYCIKGAVPALAATAIVANSPVYVTATAGSLDDAVVANQGVSGAQWISADAGGKADVLLDHPNIGAF